MSLFDAWEPINFWLDGTFNRPFKEVERYHVYALKNGSTVIMVNTVGIKKEDLKLKMEDGILSIEGETVVPDLDVHNSVSYNFRISKERPIKKMTYKVVDGYTYVYFHYAEPETVAINYEEQLNYLIYNL